MYNGAYRKNEIFKMKEFREYRPLVPILVCLISGILADRLFFSSEEFEQGFSRFVFGWIVLFLLGFTGIVFHFRKNSAPIQLPEKYQRFAFTLLSRLPDSCRGFFSGVSLRLRRLFAEPMFWILLAVTAFGGLWHHLYWHTYSAEEIGFCFADPFSLECVEGKVLRPPQFSLPHPNAEFSTSNEGEVVTLLLLKIRARKKGEEWVRASGKLLVRVRGYLGNVHSGDLVQMSGRLSKPPEAMNPGAFSPKNFYRQQRILAILRVPGPENPKVVSTPWIWGVFRFVEFLRNSAARNLEKHLTPETRPMASALILGCREEISAEEKNLMLETGTIHLMAISGLHVGLLAGGFFIFFRSFGTVTFWTVLLILFLVWVYVLLTGARPPAVRAGVIVTVSLLAESFSRPHSRLNTLAAAGILILLLNPTALFSTGTQLSFLAVGTLIFTPYLTAAKLGFENGAEVVRLNEKTAGSKSSEKKFSRSKPIFSLKGTDLKNRFSALLQRNRQTKAASRQEDSSIPQRDVPAETKRENTTETKRRNSAETILARSSAPVRVAKPQDERKLILLQTAPEYLLVREANRSAILKNIFAQLAAGVVNLILSSFLMTVVLLPLVVGSFHVAAFIGIFLNILLWPPLMLAMMSGSLVILLGVVPGIGTLAGILCSSALASMAWLIHLGASIPGHCLWMRGTPVFWTVLLYSTLIFWGLFPKFRFKTKKGYALYFLGLLLLLVPGMWLDSAQKQEFRCSFISVSHGLSVLMQFPNGKNILYDAGQFTPSEYPAQTVSAFLWKAGVRRLDAVVLSHPDMDHYNALSSILERFPTDSVLFSPQTAAVLANLDEGPAGSHTSNVPSNSESRQSELAVSAPGSRLTSEERKAAVEEQTAVLLRKFRDSVSAAGCQVQILSAGDQISISPESTISVLHPTQSCLEANPDLTNANSLVLLIEHQGVKFLLTGDLAPPGTGSFLLQKPTECDVVLAPHHGAKNCCTPEFAAWCKPKHFVISESFNSLQKTAQDLFREFGAKVYHTGRDGAVIFRVKDQKLSVLTRNEWKDQHRWK